jgi:hypothetical protein
MSHVRNTSKTCRSSSVFTKLTAARMKRNSSELENVLPEDLTGVRTCGRDRDEYPERPAAMIIGIDFSGVFAPRMTHVTEAE